MKLVYTKAITKDVHKIKDAKIKKVLKALLEQLKLVENLEDVPNVKKLKGYENIYRIRVGDYRLGFYLEKNTFILARFVHRKDIYNLFP